MNMRSPAVSPILLVALLPALLFLSSCDFNKTESEKGFENPLAHVGTIHNQGLDHVLGDIKETEIKERDLLKKQGRTVLSDVVETSAQAFLEERGLGPESIKASKIGMSVVRSGRGTGLRKNDDDGILRLLPDSLRGDLTGKQKKYLQEVGSVILNEPPMSKLKKRLNELGKSARDDLSEEDATPVFAAIALGKSSSKYWRDNLNQWRQAVINALPEPDSTIEKTAGGNMSKAKCKCKTLKEVKITHHPDGTVTRTYIYECGCGSGQSGGNGGFWENAGEVAAVDVASGTAGAAVGGATTSGPGALPGGVGTALIGSAGSAAGKVLGMITRKNL